MREDVRIGCGTLALGMEYRILAKLLAYDLALYHPEMVLYIFSDSPESFVGFPNVKAVKHQFGGVRACYHDKRHVIANVLSVEDVCIFLDADSRLIDRIDLSEVIKDGYFLVAPWASSLSDKLDSEIAAWKGRMSINSPIRKKKLFARLAGRFGLDMADVLFVQESLIVVNKKYGNYVEFLKTWDHCATYMTARLFEFAEGSSIGLSAKVSGGDVFSLSKNPSWYFKDIYTNHEWKTEAQRAVSQRMTVLRNSISKDFHNKFGTFSRVALIVWRYCRFVLLNRLRLFSIS